MEAKANSCHDAHEDEVVDPEVGCILPEPSCGLYQKGSQVLSTRHRPAWLSCFQHSKAHKLSWVNQSCIIVARHSWRQDDAGI